MYEGKSTDGKVRVNFEWTPVGTGGEFGPTLTVRTPVVGGWLVCVERTNVVDKSAAKVQSVTFVPDPEHRWVATS